MEMAYTYIGSYQQNGTNYFAVPVIIMLQVIDRGQLNIAIYYYCIMIQLPPFIPISYSQRTSPVQPDYDPHNIEFYLFNMSIPSI